MNDQKFVRPDPRTGRPVRHRRRRRRVNPSFILLLVAVVVLLAVLIGLLVWGVSLLSGNQDKDQSRAPETSQTQASAQTTQPSASEPVTEPTQPIPTTPLERVEAFAAEHGYTLADYPEKLLQLLERNPDAEEFVKNYPLEYGKPHAIDISGHVDDPGVPLFIQWDKQWGYKDYVGNIGGLSGCGPTCLSMVVFHFTRDPAMHPAYMMEFAESNRNYATPTTATMWALFGQGAKEFGLDVKELTAEQLNSERMLANILESGRLIVAHMGPGVFTEIGHYIVITGYEDGKFRVNDPNSYVNSEKLWDFEEFSGQAKMMWSFDK